MQENNPDFRLTPYTMDAILQSTKLYNLYTFLEKQNDTFLDYFIPAMSENRDEDLAIWDRNYDPAIFIRDALKTKKCNTIFVLSAPVK